MALVPNGLQGQDKLQPGARGETFQVNQPGYRDGGDYVNRTNNKLNVCEHDVPNVKWAFDSRLPVLFKYGFAYGYNQIVIPKGRVIAADPHMDMVDTDMKKQYNTLTLANGGVPVRLRTMSDLYKDSSSASTPSSCLVSTEKQKQAVHNVGKDWVPVIGMEAAYEHVTFRPFKPIKTESGTIQNSPTYQLTNAKYKVDPETGKIVNLTDGTATSVVIRPGNTPLGVLGRNEYTRDEDAMNGIMPGPVYTDKLIELPWFAYKDKAEQNPWGSAYGGLFPGALVKSDENGRFVVSPLSIEGALEDMGVAEYEWERQQVIGQVYSVFNDLLPEAAAKWATWALEDRLNSEAFNPAIYAQNNRRGEDTVSHSPYNSTGQYPGYPYERAYMNNDLHMLASTGRMDNYDQRLNQQYQIDNLGIPGLTDGYNAVVRDIPEFAVGELHYAGGKDYIDVYFKTLDVNIEPGSLKVRFDDEAATQNVVEGGKLTVGGKEFLDVKYCDYQKGIIVLHVNSKADADAVLNDAARAAKCTTLKLSYKKRGLAGVPTFLDWDGAVGSVKILLQK